MASKAIGNSFISVGDQQYGERKKLTPKYTFVLVISVGILFFLMIERLILKGHNAIWRTDEMYQMVNGMLYFSRSVRAAIKSFIAGNGFLLPTYSLNIGYGTDTFYLFSSYACDPFNWISIICPGKYIEYCDVLLIYLRLLACALTFSVFSLWNRNTYKSTFIGALLYSTSGILVIGFGLTHPNILTTAVLFPLILHGADLIFEERSPNVLVVSLAIETLISIYYSYMVCVLLFFYCLFKFIFLHEDRSIGSFVKIVARFVVYVLLAFVISSVTTIQRVMNLLSQDRISLGRYSSVLYEPRRIIALFSDMLAAMPYNPNAYIGPIALFLVIAYFATKKIENRRRYTCSIVIAVMMLLSIVFTLPSKVLNGFTYSTDRWMFAYALFTSYLATRGYEEFERDNVDFEKVILTCCLFIVVGCCSTIYLGISKVYYFLFYMILFIVVSLSELIIIKSKQQIAARVFCCGILISTALLGFLFADGRGMGKLTGYIKRGTAYGTIVKWSYAKNFDDMVEDDGVYRYSAANGYGMRNTSLNHKHYSIDYYKSMYNQYTDSFRSELGFFDEGMNIRYRGSDSRLAVEGITGSKYFLTTESSTSRIPYGYTPYIVPKSGYQIWESTSSLPLAFSTSKAMKRSDYETLSFVERQQALTQAAIVDDAEISDLDEATFVSTSKEIDYEMKYDENDFQFENDGILVLRGNSTLHLEFDGLEESETYIQFKNIEYEQLLPSELAKKRGDYDEDINYAKRDRLITYPKDYLITLQGAKILKRLTVLTNRHPQYGGKNSWMINMEYAKEKQTGFDITFGSAGFYRIEGISVICQPVKPIYDALNSLADFDGENIQFDGRHFTFDVDTKEGNSLVVVTIPYDKSWHFVVDGKETKQIVADTAFMGVKINGGGSHKVEMTYKSNTSTPSLIATIAGIVCLVIYNTLITKRKNRSMLSITDNR